MRKPVRIDLAKLPAGLSSGWVGTAAPFDVVYTVTLTIKGGRRVEPRKIAAALRRAARELELSRRDVRTTHHRRGDVDVTATVDQPARTTRKVRP